MKPYGRRPPSRGHKPHGSSCGVCCPAGKPLPRGAQVRHAVVDALSAEACSESEAWCEVLDDELAHACSDFEVRKP